MEQVWRTGRCRQAGAGTDDDVFVLAAAQAPADQVQRWELSPEHGTALFWGEFRGIAARSACPERHSEVPKAFCYGFVEPLLECFPFRLETFGR